MITTLEDLIKGEEAPKKELKPIEFKYVINLNEISIGSAIMYPNDFDEVVLIEKSSRYELDLIFARQSGWKNWNKYLGHWNDGIK